jgi:Lrp/AsnC family leucine-responsive transcriptional regulator
MDRIDRQLLGLLQRDARISNAALADRIGLSESACLRRVRALEESGVIRAYTAVLDQRKAGLPVNVWVTVTLDTQKQKGLEAFEQAIGRIPEVMECYLMSGQSDYMLRVVVADLDDFERLHSQHLTRLPNVSRIQSSFAVRTVVRDAVLPIR